MCYLGEEPNGFLENLLEGIAIVTANFTYAAHRLRTLMKIILHDRFCHYIVHSDIEAPLAIMNKKHERSLPQWEHVSLEPLPDEYTERLRIHPCLANRYP